MTTLFYSEAAYNEAREEEADAPYGGYGNAMAQEMADQHRNGGFCSFDCAACDIGDVEADEEARRADLSPEERLAEDVAWDEVLAYREKAEREPAVDPWL